MTAKEVYNEIEANFKDKMKEAIEKTGASWAIKRCVKNPELKSGGYQWKYADD